MTAFPTEPVREPVPEVVTLDRLRGGRDTDAVALRLSCPDFVGRVEELHELTSALDRASAGRAAAVLISGEAGIGKSRLVDELAERARDVGALVATGRCIPVDGEGLPYAPVAGLLRDLAHRLGPSVAGEVLGPLAAGLGLQIGPVDPAGTAELYSAVPHLTDQLARTRLFESILAAILVLADRSPVVLVFEDLQWADSASAGLVSFLVRNLADVRVLLVGTYRSEDLGPGHELRPWLSELARHPRVAHLSLGGLDLDETAALIGGLIGEPPEWALAEAVWARSQGNAFFVEELTASRASRTLSPALRDVILTRVGTLSPDTQELLRTAAVAGTVVGHRLLQAACALDADAFGSSLAEAVDKQVLVVDGTDGYQFRHALLREAIEDVLLPGDRQELHRRLALLLTAEPSLGSPDPSHRNAELAAHWWAAGDWRNALEFSKAAADDAAAVFAFPESLTHLQRALAAMDRAPDLATVEDRLALLERAADAAYLAGDGEAAVERARAAIGLIDAEAEPATAARAYALLGRNAWSLGDSDAAFAAYREALALVPTEPPSALLARVLAEEARGCMLMARYGDAIRRGLEALDVALAVGARAEEGHVRYTLGCSRASLGFFDEGIALVREALAIAEELGGADDLNRAYMGLSALLVDAGRLEEGAGLVFDSAAVGEELWGVRLNGAAGNSVEALIRLGRHHQAEALLAQTDDRGVGSCNGGPILRATIGIRCGRFEQAARDLAIADDVTWRLSDLQHRGVFHLQSAELALLERRPDDAYEHIERVLTLAAATDDEWYRPEIYAMAVRTLADLVDDALVDRRRFDVDKARLLAREYVEEARGIVAAPGERGGATSPRMAAMAALCIAEETRLHEPAPDRWAEAVERWEAAQEPYGAAYCRWREAEAVLAGDGDRARAGELLRQAWRVSDELGARPLQERVEGLARRARIPVAGTAAVVPDDETVLGSDLGLTPREVEVLGQLAAGRRDGEIAESLFISKKTVSVHVSNILRKLDVPNRIEAGRIGQAHGLG